MATMNISLPDDMKAFIEQQRPSEGFGTTSEYMRVTDPRTLRDHRAERDRVDGLPPGWISTPGPATPMTRGIGNRSGSKSRGGTRPTRD